MIYSKVLILLISVIPPVPAPVPRCSPFIFINKLAEWTNVWSDSNPYFPVPPCEYGGPLEALARGDFQSVFVTAQPLKISLHNFYEFVWLLKTGIPRMLRILAGTEPFIHDSSILREGYQHYTPNIRTTQLGHDTPRRPEIIDNFKTFKTIVVDKIGKLANEGPDRHATAFTPLGNLPSRSIQYPQYRLAEKDQVQSIGQQNSDPQVWQYSQPSDLQRLQYNQLPDLQYFQNNQHNQNLIKLYQQLEEPHFQKHQNQNNHQQRLSRQIYQNLINLKYANRRNFEDNSFDLISVPSEVKPVSIPRLRRQT